jgi:hypothetical protein
MRWFARVSAMLLAALLVSACSEYLPNAPEKLPEGGAPQTDRGLVVDVTSDQSRISQEGEVVFTVNTTGGNGNYRYSWTAVDCHEDPTGRERCDWSSTQFFEGGSTITFSRYRRAIDTRLTLTVTAQEFSTAKSGQDVHYLLGPNDRTD